MSKVSRIVWTQLAQKALKEILNYRYKNIPSARTAVRSAIISASKNIVFYTQYQNDEIFPQYRRIYVRDYKLLYTQRKGVVYIVNVVCTRAK